VIAVAGAAACPPTWLGLPRCLPANLARAPTAPTVADITTTAITTTARRRRLNGASLLLRQPFLRVVHPPIALRPGRSRLRQFQRTLVTGV